MDEHMTDATIAVSTACADAATGTRSLLSLNKKSQLKKGKGVIRKTMELETAPIPVANNNAIDKAWLT